MSTNSKEMKKKTLAMILSFVLLFVLSSCDKTMPESENEKVNFALSGLSTLCSLKGQNNDFLLNSYNECEVKSFNLPLTNFKSTIDYSKSITKNFITYDDTSQMWLVRVNNIDISLDSWKNNLSCKILDGGKISLRIIGKADFTIDIDNGEIGCKDGLIYITEGTKIVVFTGLSNKYTFESSSTLKTYSWDNCYIVTKTGTFKIFADNESKATKANYIYKKNKWILQ